MKLEERFERLPSLLNIRIQEFIDTIDITRQTYGRLRAGQSRPSFDTCRLILQEYPVNPYWFFFGHGDALISQESHQRMMLEHPKSDQTLSGLQAQVNELRKILADQTARIDRLESSLDN